MKLNNIKNILKPKTEEEINYAISKLPTHRKFICLLQKNEKYFLEIEDLRKFIYNFEKKYGILHCEIKNFKAQSNYSIYNFYNICVWFFENHEFVKININFSYNCIFIHSITKENVI